MNKKTEAKCSGMTLTVGFHSAHPPLIWRFDLERNHSFTLSLQGEEGDWELGITSPKGDFYGVAHFSTREDAEEALIKVEKVLSRTKGGFSILKALLTLTLVALLVIAAVVVFGKIVSHGTGPMLSSAGPASIAPAPAAIEEGVPQSADDVLKPPLR